MVFENKKYAVIRINKETRKNLKLLGMKGETYDEIIQKIMVKNDPKKRAD